jgi:hypothetical protein
MPRSRRPRGKARFERGRGRGAVVRVVRIQPPCRAARVGRVDGEIGHDAPRPPAHHHHALRQEHRLEHTVRDEQRGEPLCLPQRQQFAVQALAGDLVEGGERLVHQQQVGPRDERAGDRHAHFQATRQLVWQGVGKARQAQCVEQRRHLRTRRVARCAAQAQRQPDVVDHAGPRHQRGVLEHVRDHGRRAVVTECDAAAGRRIQTGGQPQRGRLAATRGAEQGDEAAGGHVE